MGSRKSLPGALRQPSPRPKTAPSHPEDGLGGLPTGHEAFQTVEGAPKTAREGSQSTPTSAPRGQNSSFIVGFERICGFLPFRASNAPRRLKRRPRPSRNGPKAPKKARRGRQKLLGSPQMTREGPRTAHDAPRDVPGEATDRPRMAPRERTRHHNSCLPLPHAP